MTPETGLEMVPKPSASLSLYEMEDDLLALLDTAEGGIAPEQEDEFQLELARQLLEVRAKRDRVAGFIKSCEAAALFAAAEIKRLQERKDVFENAARRLREYVAGVIDHMGLDAKGKRRKLEGERFTLSAYSSPASVVVTDQAAIPLRYKRITVTFSMAEWAQIGLILEEKAPGSTKTFEGSMSLDSSLLKADLEKGVDVPGADLEVGKIHCVIK